MNHTQMVSYDNHNDFVKAVQEAEKIGFSIIPETFRVTMAANAVSALCMYTILMRRIPK